MVTHCCYRGTGVRVGNEQPGSSSHGDTAGEDSACGVTNDSDWIYSIPHKPPKNSIQLKYGNWFSYIGVTTQSYLNKKKIANLIKLKYQSKQ